MLKSCYRGENITPCDSSLPSLCFLCRTSTCSSATIATWAPRPAFTSTSWSVQTATLYTKSRSFGPAWWRRQVRLHLEEWVNGAARNWVRFSFYLKIPSNSINASLYEFFSFFCFFFFFIFQVAQRITFRPRYLVFLRSLGLSCTGCCTNHTNWSLAKNTLRSCLCTAALRLVWYNAILKVQFVTFKQNTFINL